MKYHVRTALALGLCAMVVTTPMPAAAAVAAQRPITAGKAFAWEAGTSDYHRRHWRNRRLDVDAGDVILGIGLIAAIAAIADSSGKESPRRPRGEDRWDRPDDRRYDAERPDYSDRNDVGSAVRACTDAAERSSNGRVDEIGSVVREGDGWQVSGNVGDDSFDCEVSNGVVGSIRFSDRQI